MSTAWRGSEVLWREPGHIVAARIGRRLGIAALGFVLSGVPGTAWTGPAPWLWFRIPFLIVGLLGLVLLVLAVANAVRRRRVILAIMGTGSVERPRSIQEMWLRRPQEYVMGRTITVTPHPLVFRPSASEPYVTLSGEGGIPRVPLFLTKPEAFIEQVNEIAKGRGVTFVLAEPDAEPAADA